MKLKYVIRRFTSEVELTKDEECPLGISITGSQKDRGRPTVTNIKLGSVAYKSHCLSEGDIIVSVRGIDTRGMSKKDVKRFFKDSNPQLNMKVEYIAQEACFGYCRIYCAQRMYLTLRKVNGSFGFVLRKNSGFVEYPLISNIKHGSPADRDGIMMTGDRLLEVNNQSLSWIPLTEVVKLLQDKEEAIFLIEYNVGIVDLPKEKEIHLEITCPDVELGMTVTGDDSLKMTVSFIQQGSLAQRCGVFHVGDEILSINGVDVKTMTSAKANDLLRRFRKGSGKITFLHEGENLKHETRVCQTTPKMVSSSPTFSHPIYVPPNSWASSYYDPIPENVFFKLMENYENHNNFQLEIMSILRDMLVNADNLQLNLSNEKSNANSPNTEIDETDVSNQSDQTSEFGRPKGPVYQLMKLTRALVIHVLKNAAQIAPVTRTRKKMQQCEELPGSTISDKVKIELINSLNEFANRRLMSKNSAKKLIATAVEINLNCPVCVNEFYTASFAVRKVHLLLSLNNTTQQEINIIRHVLKRINQLPFPCYECQRPSSTGSTTKTQISQPVQKNEKNTIPPRTFGVGASSSSIDSAKDTGDKTVSINNSKIPTEPYVGLNLSQQTVMYRLKQNEDTNSKVTNSDSFRSSEERHTSQSSIKSTDQSSFTRLHQHAINSHVYSQTGLRYNSNVVHDYEDNAPSKLRTKLTTPSKISSTLTTLSKCDSTLTSLTEADKQRAISIEDLQGLPSVRPKHTFERHSTPLPQSPVHKPLCQCKSSVGFDVINEDPPPMAGLGHATDGTPVKNSSHKSNLQTHTDTHDVLLKSENGSFGFILGYSSLLVNDGNRVPIISAIKPRSSAHKCGLLKKGDRILALNGFGTVGISIGNLESLKREVFNFDEVVLTVEFDVVDADDRWGTFPIELETCLKLGLVMDEPGYPSFVRGVVKGSSAHRSGQLLPGDEILSFSTLNEETLNLQTWTMKKTKIHRLTVRREQNNELHKMEANKRYFEFPLDPVSFVRSGSHFNIKRTSVRTIEGGGGGRDKMVLEQEFTLFRDPLLWDFGFLFGENPQTGNAYITDIRPGGPADNSKIIKKYDRIIEVNGVLVDNTVKNSVMALFVQTDDRVNLVTRRILHY